MSRRRRKAEHCQQTYDQMRVEVHLLTLVSNSCAASPSHSSLVLGPLPLKLGGAILTGAPGRDGVETSATGVVASGGGRVAAVDDFRGRPARVAGGLLDDMLCEEG